MNLRLLGVLVMVIGTGLAMYSINRIGTAKSQMAELKMSGFIRAAHGQSAYPIDGPTPADLEQAKEDAKQQMTIGWVIAALGFAVAVAAKSSTKINPSNAAPDDT